MSHHDRHVEEPTELTPEEVEAQEGERLPDREVMSVISTEPPIVDPALPEDPWTSVEDPAPPSATT
jgi:hypothetical protein